MKFDYEKVGDINLIKLENDLGLKVLLSKTGAAIYAIYLDDVLMTLTPASLKDFYKNNAYYGKTVGPIANRIKDGLLKVGEETYQFEQNEGNNCLHSGKNGLSNVIFDIANIHDKNDSITVIFKYLPKPGNSELPGHIIYQIAYTISNKDNTLEISFNVMNDMDSAFALTNHSYFTLGDKNIHNLTLTIPSHRFVETGKEDLIPIQERDILPCLDFNVGKNLMKDIMDAYLQNHRSFGYDHCFLLDKGKIKLENDKYILNITTDFPAVQIYSDNYKDGIKMIGTEEECHRGVAIEPQDSILTRDFVKKGSVYCRNIVYNFVKK